MEVKVCAIIRNSQNDILLQLRDEEPGKDTWVLFGGGVQNGETEEQALRRELEEELEFKCSGFDFLGRYEYGGLQQSVYAVREPVSGKKLVLHEGGGMDFFSAKDLQTLAIGFNFRNVIDDYFKSNEYGKPKL